MSSTLRSKAGILLTASTLAFGALVVSPNAPRFFDKNTSKPAISSIEPLVGALPSEPSIRLSDGRLMGGGQLRSHKFVEEFSALMGKDSAWVDSVLSKKAGSMQEDFDKLVNLRDNIIRQDGARLARPRAFIGDSTLAAEVALIHLGEEIFAIPASVLMAFMLVESHAQPYAKGFGRGLFQITRISQRSSWDYVDMQLNALGRDIVGGRLSHLARDRKAVLSPAVNLCMACKEIWRKGYRHGAGATRVERVAFHFNGVEGIQGPYSHSVRRLWEYFSQASPGKSPSLEKPLYSLENLPVTQQ